ncbi:MAG: Integrase [Nocardioides sp.]|nr:Integrase [Nocardioides sp.]
MSGRDGGRSANGRSSIYRDARGTWHGYVTMGRSTDGKTVRRHVRGQTRSEVTTKVEALELERARTGRRAVDQRRMTTGDWLDEWLVIIERTRKPMTYDGYASLIRVHAGPLADMPLTQVTVRDIDDLLHHVAKKAPSSAARLHRILSSSFNTAIKRGLLAANPCTHAVVPRTQTTEYDPFTIEQCRRILEAAQHEPNPSRWTVALSLGLRQGESLGLQWSDIDLDTGQLRVRRQLQRRAWHHGCGERSPDHTPAKCPQRRGGGWSFEDVKSRAGRRTVVLPGPLVQQLREHHRQQAADRLAAGPVWNDHDLVFPRPDGLPMHFSSDGEAWKRLLRRAEVPMLRLHYARHTTATMLLAQGVDGRVVMALLGWSQASLLTRYQHVMDPMRIDAAARVETALWGR